MKRSRLTVLFALAIVANASPASSQEARQDTVRGASATRRAPALQFAGSGRGATYASLRDSLNAIRVRAGLAPIPYADLPTGGGTWANGGNLSITGGVTTVAGLTSNGNILPNASSSRSVGTLGTGFKEVVIEHTTNMGTGLVLRSTATGFAAPRIHFENTVDWAAQGVAISNGSANTMTFYTGTTAGSTTGTARWAYNTTDLYPNTTGGLGLGTTSLRWGAAWVGALTATTGTYSGDVITTSDDLTVGSGVTTGNVDARVTVNAGTNAGANNRDSYVEFQRGTTPLWRLGQLGSTGTTSQLLRVYDNVNSIVVAEFPGSASTPSFDVNNSHTTQNTGGRIAINAGTNSGANNKDTQVEWRRGQTALWRAGVLGSVAANGNWTLRDVANSVNPLVIAPSTGTATFAGAVSTQALTATTGTFSSDVLTTNGQLRSVRASTEPGVRMQRTTDATNNPQWDIGRIQAGGLSNFRFLYKDDVTTEAPAAELTKAGALLLTGGFTATTGTLSGLLTASADIAMATGSGNNIIRTTTTNGSDNAAAFLTGGGAVNFGRGGFIGLYGTDHATSPGRVLIASDSGSQIFLQAGSFNTVATFQTNLVTLPKPTVVGTDPGGSELLRVGGTVRFGSMTQTTNVDGQPTFAQTDSLKQLSMGDSPKGGYILLNGLNYGVDKGDVLITGNARTSGTGDIKIRRWNGSSADTNAVFRANGTFEVGLPAGTAITGTGRINVAGDVYKNGSAYTNPDYVFETAYEGAPRTLAPDAYRVRPLAEVEQFTKAHLHLPGISREASGMFARADMLLEKVEELYLHAFDLDRRIKALEAENESLKAQVEELSRANEQ